jgi:hypothetical protein
MTNNDLRREIRRALRTVWPAFATAHPRLAMLMDDDLVLDAAVERFGDDADYQDALADAAARRVADWEMAKLIRRLTKCWLQTLI